MQFIGELIAILHSLDDTDQEQAADMLRAWLTNKCEVGLDVP